MKRWLLWAFVVIALVAFAIWVTTPRSFSHEDDGRIDTWQTDPQPRKTWEPTSGTVERGRHKVRRFKTVVRSRQQLRTDARGSCGYKTRARIRLIGGNEMVPDVVEANATVTWCGWGDDITSHVQVNTWGDGRMLWEYHGVIDRVQGHGRNTHGVEYAYRRIYFKWTRGLPQAGVTQSVTGWISVTVRGDLTCTADKYQQNGQEAC